MDVASSLAMIQELVSTLTKESAEGEDQDVTTKIGQVYLRLGMPIFRAKAHPFHITQN